MKKILLSSLSIAVLAFSANAQNPDEHQETFNKGIDVSPCFLGYIDGPGAFQYAPGHDFKNMAWDETEGAMTFKATSTAPHAPMFYQLSGGDAANCLPAQGLVDISTVQKIKIRAKSSVPFKLTAYVQEGNTIVFDYSKFSNKTVVMNLTTEYQDFEFDGGVLDSNISKTAKIDPKQIGVIAFELGKVDDVWQTVTDATVSIDYIKLGNFENSVSEVAASSFSVYPNPASDLLNVTVASAATIELADLAGNVVSAQTATGASTVQVNTAGLAAGLYVVTVKSSNGTASQKVAVK